MLGNALISKRPAIGQVRDLKKNNYMLVTQHPLSAGAGAEILEKGGNAVDGAIASAFASCVVEPMMTSIAGGGFMIIYLSDADETVVVDYNGETPAAASPHLFEDSLVEGRKGMFMWRAVKHDANLHGCKSVIVPGNVAGLSLALQKFGTMRLDEVMRPAIRYAENGFKADWFMSLMIANSMQLLSKNATAASIFLKDGFPPKYGVALPAEPPDAIVQKDLAETLKAISQDGPEAFYKGEIAQDIVKYLEENGGIVTSQDLANYRPELLKVRPGRYRGLEVIFCPTSSGGPTVMETLKILENFDIGKLAHNSSQVLHLLIEALKSAFADRFRHMTDPRFMHERLARFVSGQYCNELSRRIDPTKAAALYTCGSRNASCTSYLSVVDRERNVVSLNQTAGSLFGSGVVIPHRGILMWNGMVWFNPEPGSPSSVGPKKKPLANMSPLVVFTDGEPVLSLGASGGRKIISAVTQVLMNVVDFRMHMRKATNSPRIAYDGIELVVNEAISKRSLEGLQGRGHTMILASPAPGDRSFASPRGILMKKKTLEGGIDQYNPGAISTG